MTECELKYENQSGNNTGQRPTEMQTVRTPNMFSSQIVTIQLLCDVPRRCVYFGGALQLAASHPDASGYLIRDMEGHDKTAVSDAP